MLEIDPTVRATVIRERLRPLGYRGGITILKDHLAQVRPGFLAARAFQRTSYRPVGGRARLHAEVSGLLGALRAQAIVLRPRRPTSKGHAERTIGYLETSFLPLRGFDSLADLRGQHDAWAGEVAFARRLRRTGTTVAGGWAVERGHLAPLPEPLSDTDLHLEARAVKG
jgi:transposase